ncbi:IF4E-domain-containing protein [Tothia fuscella]|uniref:IF4E-domain-containing protein n=1 Tax=Tothia fuscella TaxID=1048955 RepID=A0A9P4NEV1_9PEZI|nr:IF4E-domain-containing protein [Tothia fuscella]
MDRENLWSRRSASSKLSLTTSNNDHGDSRGDHSSRTFSSTSKRFGGDSSSHGGRSNPLSALPPLGSANVSSPTAGASAFGLGTGAFASFGSATKTPKTPGTAFDFGKAVGAMGSTPTTPKGNSKAPSRAVPTVKAEKLPIKEVEKEGVQSTNDVASTSDDESPQPYSLRYSWVVWYRPPTSKNSDYEKSIQPLCRMESVQDFWQVYTHLKRPSMLPTVSDYHFFREGIRPVWEDEANCQGGKFIMRLKKGVCDRYWEDLLLAMIGDQFDRASDEVCGAVLSVRAQEDVLSIWTKLDGGRNTVIRQVIYRTLNLPADTALIFKSHDDSIAQRSAIDQARQEKTLHEKRRTTLSSDDGPLLTPSRERANGL